MESPKEVLLGRIAVKRGFLSREELAMALEEQARRDNPPLGVLLVQLGLLSQMQIDGLLEEQRRALAAPAWQGQLAGAPSPPAAPTTTGENLLGRRAVELGLVSQEQLNECIRLQGTREADGRLQRLGEILVERGLVTETQIETLLAAQGKRLLRCPQCHGQFNVAGDGPAPGCPKCGVPLVPAAPAPPAISPDSTAVTVVRPAPPKPAVPANVSAEGTIWIPKVEVPSPARKRSGDTTRRHAAPPPPARPHGGGTTHRTTKVTKPKYVSYRKRRLSGAPAPAWIGAAAIGLIVLVGFLVMHSSGDTTTTRATTDADDPSSTSAAPTAEAWKDYVATLPANDPVEAIHRLERLDPNGALGARAREEIRRREESLRRQLTEEFDKRRKEAQACVSRDEFANALSAWEGFPLALDLRLEWRDRVAKEVSSISDRRDSVFHEIKEMVPRLVAQKNPAEAERMIARLSHFGYSWAQEQADHLRQSMAQGPAPTPGPGASEATRRVDEARASVARRRKALADERAAAIVRLREATEKKPMDLDVNGAPLKGCVFTEANEDGGIIKVKDPPMTSSVFFSYLPPATLYRIRKTMTDPEDVPARFALGSYAARLGLYKEAENEFKWVTTKDASYQSKLPDLAKLKQRGIVFHGAVKNNYDQYKVTYEFTSPDEALDFQADRGEMSVDKGQLVLKGDRVVQARLKEVAFAGEATLTVAMGEVPDGTMVGWGLGLQCSDGHSVSLYVSSTQGQLVVLAQTPDGQGYQEKATLAAGKKDELSFQLRQGTQIALLKDKTVLWSDTVAPVTSCGIVLIGYRKQPGEVRASFERIVMDGKIRKEWMRKARAGSEVRALRTLEEDLNLPDDDTDRPLEPLSIEANARISSSQMEVYRDARRTLEKREVTYREIFEVMAKLVDLAEQEPGFAGTYYVLARLCSRIGIDDRAAEALSKAIEVEPRFYEALVERARLSIERREIAAARKDIEAALALKADFEPAISARGYVQIAERKFVEAQDDLEVALALDPADRTALHLLKDARHLVAGPWPKGCGKTEAVGETEHYRVRTDMGAKKAKEFAARLEKARLVYEEAIPPPAGAPAHAEVVVFDTEEAYHTYAELTGDDAVESTLGYYHPLYDQLFLFEGATDVTGLETAHVLFHEGFHQYLDPIVPFAPTWMNEGLAEYYAGKAFVKDTGQKKDPFLMARLQNLQSALGQGFKCDFVTIMDMSQAEFYSDLAPVLYAQGWAMCHWLLEVAPKGEQDGFHAYVAALQRGRTREEARQEAFAGKDMKDMERRWIDWVKAWKP